MREIEVKARLKDKAKVIEMATSLGIRFGEPFAQDDITYETSLPKDNPSWNVFRIRKQNNTFILTMKYKASLKTQDNHERESIILNADEVADMLERVGYTFGVRIRKTRQIAKYSGLEICIDDVDRLGSFVEVEKLADEDADVDKVQRELWSLLHRLGVNEADGVHKGYDTLMHELIDSEKY